MLLLTADPGYPPRNEIAIALTAVAKVSESGTCLFLLQALITDATY